MPFCIFAPCSSQCSNLNTFPLHNPTGPLPASLAFYFCAFRPGPKIPCLSFLRPTYGGIAPVRITPFLFSIPRDHGLRWCASFRGRCVQFVISGVSLSEIVNGAEVNANGNWQWQLMGAVCSTQLCVFHISTMVPRVWHSIVWWILMLYII